MIARVRDDLLGAMIIYVDSIKSLYISRWSTMLDQAWTGMSLSGPFSTDQLTKQ